MRPNETPSWSAFGLLLLASACSGGAPGLSADEIRSIPDGDATGSAASRSYALETLTTGCEGACNASVSGFTVSVCDLGDRIDATATITQTDGHLQVDSSDSDYISRLEGGIDADGGFDVGGIRTLLGSVDANIRAGGTITPAGTLSGTARGWVYGSASGASFDCRITTELTGAPAAP